MNNRAAWRRAGIVVLLCVSAAFVSPAQTFTTLVYFLGSNGGGPVAPLVQGIDGELYGTTTQNGSIYYGTVFKTTTAGLLTTLHTFNSTDGASPTSGLVLDRGGNFYGTTLWGGTTNNNPVGRDHQQQLLGWLRHN